MARIKIEGYDKEHQMYRCDKTDKEICMNCISWQFTDVLPKMKSCTDGMDSISPYMSCDKFKEKSDDDLK